MLLLSWSLRDDGPSKLARPEPTRKHIQWDGPKLPSRSERLWELVGDVAGRFLWIMTPLRTAYVPFAQQLNLLRIRGANVGDPLTVAGPINVQCTLWTEPTRVRHFAA